VFLVSVAAGDALLGRGQALQKYEAMWLMLMGK